MRRDAMYDSDPQDLLRHLYAMLSGPADQLRPWDSIRELFMPDARIRIAMPGPDGTERFADWSVTDFAATARGEYAKDGFWEREVTSRVERYGNIAHIFSTYESRVGSSDTAVVGRGINSVQFLCSGGRWRIAGLVFHLEQPDTPIPDRYLTTKAEAGSRP